MVSVAATPRRDDSPRQRDGSRLAGVCVLLALLLAACGAIVRPTQAARTADPRVEYATLSPNGRALHLDFYGGRPYDINDPCSVRYDAQTEIVNGELVVAVVAQPHPKPMPSGLACDAIGYVRALDVVLPEPFTGAVIRDRVTRVALTPRPSSAP